VRRAARAKDISPPDTERLTLPLTATSPRRRALRPAAEILEPRVALTAGAALADLSVTVTSSAGRIYVGEQVTYTVTVRNNGPDQATDVVLVDQLPATGQFNPGASSVGLAAGDGVVYELVNGNGVLASGGAVSVTINVTILPSLGAEPGPPVGAPIPLVMAEAGSEADDTATVTGLQADPDTSNNSATSTVILDPVVDVSVTQGVALPTPGTIRPGQPLAYTLNVTNSSSEEANLIVLGDMLPAGVTTTAADISVLSDAGTPLDAIRVQVFPQADGRTLVAVSTPDPLFELSNTSSLTIRINAVATGPFQGVTQVTAIGFIQATAQRNTSLRTVAESVVTVDAVPPSVVSVTRTGPGASLAQLTVQFSEPLDPPSASSADNYFLVRPGDPTRIPVTVVTYDQLNDLAILAPLHPLSSIGEYYLVVVNVTDVAGNRLPGGYAVSPVVGP
jgi:uncharacterized repeat protein (TIGR01451 family)